MSLLRAAQKCNHLLRSTPHIHGVRVSQPYIVRNLSTAGPEEPPQEQPSPIDSFLQSSGSGFEYAKVFGINKHTLKTDLINMLEGSKVTIDNVKVIYNWLLYPTYMLVQFPSVSDYAAGIRAISRKGRVLTVEKAYASEWDSNNKLYDGKYVLLEGLPLNASPDDVHRFLDGCNYDSSSFQMFVRATPKLSIKMASVRFASQFEAMSAATRKNRGFFQNDQITVRVLQ